LKIANVLQACVFNDATRILNDITLNLGDFILLVIIYYLINKFQVIAGITLCCQSFGNNTNFDCANKIIAYIQRTLLIQFYYLTMKLLTLKIKSSIKVTVSVDKNHALQKKKNMKGFSKPPSSC